MGHCRVSCEPRTQIRDLTVLRFENRIIFTDIYLQGHSVCGSRVLIRCSYSFRIINKQLWAWENLRQVRTKYVNKTSKLKYSHRAFI